MTADLTRKELIALGEFIGGSVKPAITQLMRQLDAANARADASAAALERDRTFVAETINAVQSDISGREWMLTGRGPYEWDDDKYRSEFVAALTAIRQPIEKLKAIARDWTNCPTDPEAIRAARALPLHEEPKE